MGIKEPGAQQCMAGLSTRARAASMQAPTACAQHSSMAQGRQLPVTQVLELYSGLGGMRYGLDRALKLLGFDDQLKPSIVAVDINEVCMAVGCMQRRCVHASSPRVHVACCMLHAPPRQEWESQRMGACMSLHGQLSESKTLRAACGAKVCAEAVHI